MTTCSYDFDLKGGLMPKIQALIAPPPSDKAVRVNRCKKKTRNMKKSNDIDSRGTNASRSNNHKGSNGTKWSNHEFCDYCELGGDVLCCDKCPATFHLQCNEPPLDEDDIPEGEYYCKRCRVLEEMEQRAESEEIQQFETNNNNEQPHIQHEITNMENGKVHNVSVMLPTDISHEGIQVEFLKEDDSFEAVDGQDSNNNSPSDVVEPMDTDEITQVETYENPLSLLIKAAQTLNPKQFDIPPSYISSVPLPGTSKKDPPKSRRKLPHELDNGLVSFPVKTCFKCNRSCQKSALIQCDFCTLLYHADCLDPPMTALPAGRWMCPNHAEHIIDQKLLTSSRLSERIKLWNQYSGRRVDENVVKLQFLDKAHSEQEACTDETPQNLRINVPNGIKSMYKNPPNLIQHHQQFIPLDVEVDRVYKRQQLVNNGIDPPTSQETEAWLTGLVQLQGSIAEHLTKATISTKPPENKLNVKDSVNSWMDDESYAWKKVEEETAKAAKDVNKDETKQEDVPKVNDAIKTALATTTTVDDDALDKLDDKLIRALAMQRLKQLRTEVKPELRILDSTAAATCSTVTVKHLVLGEIKARAVLCPVGLDAKPTMSRLIALRYRVTTIGIGPENDVDLRTFGYCNFISMKHACITFDEATKKFELMNFSEHGTVVDNILYCPDFSKDLPLNRVPEEEPEEVEKSFKVPESPVKIKPVKRKGFKRKSRLTKPPKKTVRKLIVNKGTRRTAIAVKAVKKPKNEPARPATMCAKTTENFVACNCQSSASLVLCASNGGGWEGAAELLHGSFIRLGCLQFTFGISNYAMPSASTSMRRDDIKISNRQEDDISSNASTIAADEQEVKEEILKSN